MQTNNMGSIKRPPAWMGTQVQARPATQNIGGQADASVGTPVPVQPGQPYQYPPVGPGQPYARIVGPQISFTDPHPYHAPSQPAVQPAPGAYMPPNRRGMQLPAWLPSMGRGGAVRGMSGYNDIPVDPNAGQRLIQSMNTYNMDQFFHPFRPVNTSDPAYWTGR